VATIKVPPLRERKSDIPLLIEHFLTKINHELEKSIKKVERKALQRMMEYDWPGNVRELENMLIHAAIHTQGEIILEELIRPLFGERYFHHQKQMEAIPKEPNLKYLEKEYIARVLNQTHWHLGKTCQLLGISRPTLRNKLKIYDLSNPTKSSVA